ncbi:hypothetical protein [Hufsiella ginkgonis]|uniref:Uncharacterized protein n=1 Tax=Hufsiella ginkgonis TaxID=2695274 RepID=A0A7K1XUJ6_9SPHI|nr:hypothetical protein [Hufsiella ginkgonis]MXV14681.1 hypothetical protein [Hufsiella ginkgonis]
MRNSLKMLIPAFLAQAFCGCGIGAVLTHYVRPPLLRGDQAYQPRPISQDSLHHTANYVSGFIGSREESLTGEITSFGGLNYSRGHVMKHLNISYGGSAFFGNFYTNKIDQANPNYFKRKTFSAFQAASGINTFVSSRYTDFRLIGLNVSYTKESGDFAALRKQVLTAGDFYTIPGTSIFSAALSTEVAQRSRKSGNQQYAIRLGIATSFKKYPYQGTAAAPADRFFERSATMFGSAYVQWNKIYFVLQQSGVSRIDAGFRF